MTLENEGTTAVVPSEPAPEPAVNPEPVNLNEAAPPQEPGAAEPADDSEEVEYEGSNYRVPKPLKEALLRQADYTRKTQEVAEQRKALETRAQTLEQQAKAYAEHKQELGQLAAVESQLAQYANADWDAWDMQDPTASARGWRHYQQLQQAKGQIEANLATKEQERTAKAQQDTAKRLSETLDYAQKNIKGWTPELDRQITNFAVQEYGISPDELIQLVNPKTYRVLHHAWLNAQSSKQQQPAATTTPAIQPTERVATRSSPGAKKSLHDPTLPMDEYARRRAAGEKG